MGEEEKKQPSSEAEAKKSKMPQEDKKPDEQKTEESKPAETPPPPPEIVLKIFMHCEGCARKIKKCLKGFDGVEDVETDCKTHKVTVKGKNADPIKVLERVQKKSGRKVELLSPIPKPPSPEDAKKAEEKKDEVKPEEKKAEQSKAITVMLKVHMHCEGCAQEIRSRIMRMKGPPLHLLRVVPVGQVLLIPMRVENKCIFLQVAPKSSVATEAEMLYFVA